MHWTNYKDQNLHFLNVKPHTEHIRVHNVGIEAYYRVSEWVGGSISAVLSSRATEASLLLEVSEDQDRPRARERLL